MKKIFAIALALVMVFSMASAFAASECAVWGNNWPCDVDDNTPWCGQGAVEVVPLVKVNTACGWEFQVNECAGVVRSEDIFFAVKLTVDAYPDADWWAEASVTLEDWEGVESDLALAFGEEAGQLDMDSKKEVVYYFNGEAWVDLTNDDDDYVAALDADQDGELTLKDVALTIEEVDLNATLTCGDSWEDYELCATLASFYDGGSEEDYNKLGDYFYTFEEHPGFEDMDAVEDADPSYFDGTLTIWEENSKGTVTNKVEFLVVEGAIVTPNWNFPEYDDNDLFYNKVMADFGFGSCGTAPCVTFMNIQKNFGWNDSQTDCHKWSTKAAAIVDAECVVAIPKTGDVSVVAYAVMAVVAAAGAMLKK